MVRTRDFCLMFESFKGFKPSDGYHKEGETHRRFEYSNGLECLSALFINIIYVEYLLRECVQRGALQTGTSDVGKDHIQR